MTTADDEMIAEFIRTRGVTKCPAAVGAPTTATLDADARKLHESRGIDPIGDLHRAGKGKRATGWEGYWLRKRAQRKAAT